MLDANSPNSAIAAAMPPSLQRRTITAIAVAESRQVALFGTRTRFAMMFLVLFCLAAIWSDILAFNFAIICMIPSAGNATAAPINASHNKGESIKIIFSAQQKSLLTSTVAIAALIGNFVVVALVNSFQIRTVFTALGLLSAIATCLMPTAVRHMKVDIRNFTTFQMGFHYLLAIRFLQGVAFAANFPVIGAFASKWTYFKQNGLFVSVLVAYVQFAPAITMPASGALCATFGWPSVFYSHGAFAVAIFFTYGMFYRNSPGRHPFVGEVERSKISIGKTQLSKAEMKRIPYGAILKTPAVWAVWIAAIGDFTCINMLYLFGPIYMNRVASTGLSAAIPPLAQFAVKLLCGLISDKIRFLSETNKLRIFNTIAFFGAAGFLSAISFIDATKRRNFAIFLLSLGAGLLGAATGGFFKAGPLISKQYSHFVTGNISLGITITMIIVPFIVGGLAPDDTARQWGWIFIVTAGVLVVTNIIFCVFITADPCEWTTEAFSREASLKRAARNSARVYTINQPPPVATNTCKIER